MCTTADLDAGKISFQQSTMATCQGRNNQCTNEVCIHVYGSISDLHATNAGYYADCVSRSMRSRLVKVSQNVREVSKLRT